MRKKEAKHALYSREFCTHSFYRHIKKFHRIWYAVLSKVL